MGLVTPQTKGGPISCDELSSNYSFVLDLANSTGQLNCSKIDPVSLSTCLLANSVITNLQSKIDTSQTAIGQVAQDLTDAQTALQSNINNLTSLVNNQNTIIATLNAQIAALASQFNGLNGTVNAFNSRLLSIEGRVLSLEQAIASGIIVVWSGLVSAIPIGWQLSNGTNGSPDLRDRFIIGASLTYAVNSVGGTVNHSHTVTGGTDGTTLTINQLPYHSFNVTVNPHKHGIFGFSGGGNHEGWVDPFYSWGSGNESIGGIDRPDVSSYISNNQAGTQLIENSSSSGTTNGIGANEAHKHTFSSNTSSINNLPPYFALAYIIKI